MFTGFTPQTFQFYNELESNNNKIWWQENKSTFLNEVKKPLVDLAESMILDFGDPHIFRPNRDIRFSNNKDPYKTNASFYLSRNSTAYYFSLDKNGVIIGGGIYEPASDQLLAFRKFLETENKYKLKNILKDANQKGYELMQDDALKTAPRGFSRDHPELGLIRLKHLVIVRNLPLSNKIIFKTDFQEFLKDEFNFIREFNQILDLYVGTSKVKRW